MRWKILSTNFLIICTSGESENIGNIDNIENNDVPETIFRANFPNFPIILILTLGGIIENIEDKSEDRETSQRHFERGLNLTIERLFMILRGVRKLRRFVPYNNILCQLKYVANKGLIK